MPKKQKVIIAVIGGHDINPKVEQLAHDIGKIVAKVGAILVCGGLEGVMEEAAKGCQKAGGTTIGLLPGTSKADANQYIEIALPTSIGYARNAMVACFADITIIDPEKVWEVRKEDIVSKSKNSPFIGRKLKGAVAVTIYGGKTTHQSS